MKTVLAAICSFTLLATAYLSLSLVILHPPRANDDAWFLVAALLAAQGALTLLALAGVVSGNWIRWGLPAGAVAVIWVGASWVRATLSGPHFEGYALVLGCAMVVQSALTMAYSLIAGASSRRVAPQK
jgi:hypothetical protein